MTDLDQFARILDEAARTATAVAPAHRTASAI